MSTVPFLDLAAAVEELRPELDDAYRRVMDSGWFVLGDELAGFEAEFATATDAAETVGVGNGLDALTLGLRALDVGPGDEVLVPANTYIATWLAVSSVGARVVPVEPDPVTGNIDPTRLEAALTPRTTAIVPVHLYGLPAPMAAITSFARDNGLVVLADAAQAHGARLDGSGLGAQGDLIAWSFYPGKNLGALGDGGAVTTDHPELAERLRTLRNYGSSAKYAHEVQGANSRLDELQAAFLRVKLCHLDEWQARRTAVADRYLEGLAGTALVLPARPDRADGAVHAWHLFVVRTPRRDELADRLREQGIETLVHYPTPPYRQGAYDAELASRPDLDVDRDLATSDRLHAEVLSLPMGPHLSEPDQARVIQSIREITKAW